MLGYLKDVPRLLQDPPARALARKASGLLGSDKTPGAVVDPALRRQVHRLRRVAALLTATHDAAEASAGRSGGGRADLDREANQRLHRAGLPEATRSALRVGVREGDGAQPPPCSSP